MNRELKFRIYNKLANQFQYDLTICANGKLNEIDDKYQSNYVIQQYTGLKDKNNKELYEGDIVKFNLPNSLSYSDYLNNGLKKIAYDVDSNYIGYVAVRLNADFLGEGYVINEFWKDYMKIVSNIFENKELLK